MHNPPFAATPPSAPSPGAACKHPHHPPCIKRPALVLPLLLALALPLNAWALSVTVPDDHASVQAAITAVQGTPGAKVTINSNADFNENLTIEKSVEIVAGDGYTPTIIGSAGYITVRFHNPSGGDHTLVLRGLRVRSTASAPHLIRIESAASSTGTITALLDQLDVESL